MGSNKYPLIPPPQGDRPHLPQPGQPAPMRPDEFHPGSIANWTEFQFKGVDPPAAIYVQRDDLLVLFAATNQPVAETVTFVVRLLKVPEVAGGQPSEGGVGRTPGTVFTRGMIQTEIETLVNMPATGVNRAVQLQEGFLLSVAAVGGATTNDRGRTFVRATLVRKLVLPAPSSYDLFADYVTGQHSVSWPAGRQLYPTEGPGFLHSLQVANPAAGVDWILTASAAQRLRIISMEAQLAVANSGAARPVEIIVDDGANIYARMSANTAAPINATANINFSNAGTPSTSIVSDLYVQMPATLMIPPGHRIRSNTTNIVAGDAWTNIWFLVEEWLQAM